MAGKPDTARIVAETLAGMVTAGGIVTATTLGAPLLVVSMGAAVVGGIFKFLIASLSDQPDFQEILARIRDEQTANTVETIREALIEAMGLKPEFTEPIAELADAVEENDQARFKEALSQLFDTVMQVTAQLEAIKADTTHIPSIRDSTTDILKRVERIEGAVVSPGGPSKGKEVSPQYLKSRVESLTSEVRDLLDTEGRHKWDKISTAMTERSWQEAFALSREMGQWLEDQGDKLSPDVKVQAMLTLADVAVIRDSGFPFDDRNDTVEAWRLLDKAEAVAGTTPSEDSAQRLLRVRAKLTYIDGDKPASRKLLVSLNDPGSISLKMAFMQEEGRWSDASELAVEQDEPHRKWACAAILAHIRAGQHKRADALFAWAKTQEDTVRKSCVLAFVEATYSDVTGDGKAGGLLALGKSERGQLEQLREELSETFASAFAQGPSSGIHAEALEIAILLGHVLRDKQVCQNAADRLASWTPVSPEMGRAILRGDIDPIEGLADRFLSEHSGIFMTQMMAAMLRIEAEGNAEQALEILQPLLEEDDPDRKKEVATSILIAAQYCDVAKVEEVQQWLDDALGDSHRLARMLRAVLRTKQGNLPEASSELARAADEHDHIWLQMSVSVAAQREDWPAAATAARELTVLTGHVEAFRNEAEAWYRAGEISKSIEPLEKANELVPGHTSTVRNLAAAYHHEGRYDDAAEKYEALWQRDDHTKYLAVNYATCLALAGNVPDAVAILADHITETGSETDVEPLLIYAQLLHSQERAGDALDALLPLWDRLLDNHQYLMTVMQMGYASNREDEAHKAFERLVKMLNEGTLPEGVLKPCTLDDMREKHQEWNERRKHIGEQYLSGRLPWLIASQWIQPSSHSYLSWLIRTQPLIPLDDPGHLAEYSLYSTNGFTAAEQDGQRHLVRLVAPSANSEVVADISALMTLHRLGLLENLGAYFAKVHLPQSYKQIWLEEQSRIPHHQPGQIESRRAILEAVRGGKITVRTGTSNDQGPILDEYKKEASGNQNIVRILQAAKWLAGTGELPGSMLDIVESKQNQPAIISDEQANQVLEGNAIIADVLTLRTVYDYGLLGNLCDGLRVSIEKSELRQLETELQNQEVIDESGRWYRDLVVTLDSIPNLEFAHLDADDGEDKQATTGIRYGIDAALLSKQLGLPLLVDDRYCQQGLLGVSDAGPNAAFGTDLLLARLADDGVITAEQHADAILQLIRWRYKFLIPPISVLLTMASRFTNGLPGAQLREVAVYVQDCMRDFGLYGGPEQVEPPISMGTRVFTAWIDTVAAFVVDLWWDDRFSEEQAARLTRWMVRYLLPARPRHLSATVWRTIAHIRRDDLLAKVLINLLQKDDPRKGNRIVNRVRRTIGVNQEELASAVESVSNTMVSALNQYEKQDIRRVFIRILDIVYGRRSELTWRLLPLAERLGLVDLSKSIQGVSDDDVSVMADRNHSNRFAPRVGPIAYTGDSKRPTASFLPDALCAAHTKFRCAVLDNLLPQEHCPKTANTQATLQREADSIRAGSTGTWVPAVSRALEQLREDFLLNLAGFSQAQQRRHDQGRTLCWEHLIQPTAESLLAIDSDGWQLLPHGEEQEDTLSPALQGTATLQEMLLRYDHEVGHLTLAAPLDLGSQVRNYVEAKGHHEDVWSSLEEWLHDKSRPWRRYHACQALLSNTKCIPENEQSSFWQTVADIAELSLTENIDSDDAQVWRMETELAAHYLRTIDLSGYGLEVNRPLAVCWWAARKVTELLTHSLPTEDVPEQVRQWRADPVLRGTFPTGDAWAWLSPKAYSPCRFTTLRGFCPRSVAILIALGDLVKGNGIKSIPADVRARLRDCYCAALLTEDSIPSSDEPRVWMWDHSLLEAGKAFMVSLSPEELTESATQICIIVEGLNDATALKGAMVQLATRNEMDAVFICSRMRLYSYGHADAADMVLDLLRDSEWRDACALKVPILGWELLAQGLLFLQSREGIDWAIELPYLFLQLAEACSHDEERATFFIVALVMSSLAGNTAGALKSLGKSSHLPSLQPAISTVQGIIENLRATSRPDVVIRLQGIITMLDQF